jgi:hypothetical protein
VADISIQFHAIPEELLALVKTAVGDFRLHVVAMRSFPFAATEVGLDNLEDVLAAGSPYCQLGFTIDKPVIPVTGAMEFLDKNPGALRLIVERASKAGLRQSLLSARTDNSAILATWKKIAKRLKDMTQAGVIVTNPDTGAFVQDRNFRYSAGAKALASSGVPMLPIAGGNRIEFSKLPTKMKSQE